MLPCAATASSIAMRSRPTGRWPAPRSASSASVRGVAAGSASGVIYAKYMTPDLPAMRIVPYVETALACCQGPCRGRPGALPADHDVRGLDHRRDAVADLQGQIIRGFIDD